MEGDLRTMDLLKNFTGDFNPLVEEADDHGDQRVDFVVDDLWKPCKEEGVKRAREEELIDLFVSDEETKNKNKRSRLTMMITEKELRQRGSQLNLPDHVRAKMEELGGFEPVLVITKFVTNTDISKRHGRLSLPLEQLEKELRKNTRFLTESEWDKGRMAMLLGPKCSEPTEVSLKSWTSPKGLVIATGWGRLLAKYC